MQPIGANRRRLPLWLRVICILTFFGAYSSDAQDGKIQMKILVCQVRLVVEFSWCKTLSMAGYQCFFFIEIIIGGSEIDIEDERMLIVYCLDV